MLIKNEGLANVVLDKLYLFLRENDQRLAGRNQSEGRNIILAFGNVKINEKWRFKIMRNHTSGYGYDFHEEVGGKKSIDIYEQALAALEEQRDKEGLEELMDHGIVAGRYGWYITNL